MKLCTQFAVGPPMCLTVVGLRPRYTPVQFNCLATLFPQRRVFKEAADKIVWAKAFFLVYKEETNVVNSLLQILFFLSLKSAVFYVEADREHFGKKLNRLHLVFPLIRYRS